MECESTIINFKPDTVLTRLKLCQVLEAQLLCKIFGGRASRCIPHEVPVARFKAVVGEGESLFSLEQKACFQRA